MIRVRARIGLEIGSLTKRGRPPESRLIDRLVDNGLVARKICEVDKRGLVVEITEKGRELQKKMWNAYSAAIERHIGSKLSDSDAAKLSALLDQLGVSCDAVNASQRAKSA